MSDATPTRYDVSKTPCTAAEAAATIPEDATVVTSGFGSVGYPKAVPTALAESDRDLSLTLITGGSVGEELDTALVGSGAVARRFPYQARSAARDAINAGQMAFHDRHISTLGDEVQLAHLGTPDVAIIEAVAIGEDWLVPSTSIGHTPSFVDAVDRLIVEVNESQPLALQQFHDVYRVGLPPDREPIPVTGAADRIGSPRVQFQREKLAGVVRTERQDAPYSFRDPTAKDESIAENLASFLTGAVDRAPMYRDVLPIQFGVGSLGNALMSALGSFDFGDRDLVYFGEVIQDGLLDLIDDGDLAAASATSLALSSDGQTRLFENIDRYAEDVVLRPANLSNSPELIARLGVVAVNSALEVDIYGHVNSTHIDGSYLVNGIGGSADFFRNAPLSVAVLQSTARDGAVSRVVPMVPHVDHTEHDIDVVVTERGVADLRGLSPRERATRIIENCAHPTFRDQLDGYVERANESGGHVPHRLSESLSWHGDER